MATPVPLATPGAVGPVKIAQQPKPQQRGTAPSPGPKTVASPGPRGVTPGKNQAPPRPVQVPATPRPAPVRVPGKHKPSLNERLQSLIPTAGPSFSPAPQPTARYNIGTMTFTPPPEPTPPPDVIAATKFLYVENVQAQRWKQSILGTAPEERYVKMYVTSVKRIGFINWCTGWVIRMPESDREHMHWIVEPNQSFICGGHLEPFTPPSPSPSSGP